MATSRPKLIQVFSSFPSFLETLLYIFHGVLLLYGATLFLKAKFASHVNAFIDEWINDEWMNGTIIFLKARYVSQVNCTLLLWMMLCLICQPWKMVPFDAFKYIWWQILKKMEWLNWLNWYVLLAGPTHRALSLVLQGGVSISKHLDSLSLPFFKICLTRMFKVAKI